ncbi:MAG: hypothetical protein GY719_23180 [bacterium]|nr:hypothetical protein [bacterium]
MGPSTLRLIQGSHPEVKLGPLKVVVASRELPPFAVQAVVEEEDTYLVLSAAPQVRPPRQPLIQVLTEVHEAEPIVPGSVVVRHRQPLALLAVVHDLARDPTWKETWIAEALDGVLREAEQRRLRSLAVPVLGTVHGRLPLSRGLELIRHAVRRSAPECLERLWLVVPEHTLGSVASGLRLAEASEDLPAEPLEHPPR